VRIYLRAIDDKIGVAIASRLALLYEERLHRSSQILTEMSGVLRYEPH
jgi:hypothetical protein